MNLGDILFRDTLENHPRPLDIYLANRIVDIHADRFLVIKNHLLRLLYRFVRLMMQAAKKTSVRKLPDINPLRFDGFFDRETGLKISDLLLVFLVVIQVKRRPGDAPAIISAQLGE